MQPFLVRYRPVHVCLLQLHRLVTKRKKNDFLVFYVLNFFCIFIFYRMCAERAQEHTRTHTALTAGVEGRRHGASCCIYTAGHVREMDQSPLNTVGKKLCKGTVVTSVRMMMKSC